MYAAPDEFEYDEQSGLYYSQFIATDENGEKCQYVTWFHSETGEYSQNVYSINQISGLNEDEANQIEESKMPSLFPAPPEPEIDLGEYYRKLKLQSRQDIGNRFWKNIVTKKYYVLVTVTILVIIGFYIWKLGENSDEQQKKTDEAIHTQTFIEEQTDEMQENVEAIVPDVQVSAETNGDKSNLMDEENKQNNMQEINNVNQEEQEKIETEKEKTISNEFQEFQYAGLFVCYDPQMEGFEPWIELLEDGTFMMHLNLGDMMADVSGNYSWDEDEDIIIYLYFNDMGGTMASEAQMTMSNPDTLHFETSGFGLMGYGDNEGYFGRQ